MAISVPMNSRVAAMMFEARNHRGRRTLTRQNNKHRFPVVAFGQAFSYNYKWLTSSIDAGRSPLPASPHWPCLGINRSKPGHHVVGGPTTVRLNGFLLSNQMPDAQAKISSSASPSTFSSKAFASSSHKRIRSRRRRHPARRTR